MKRFYQMKPASGGAVEDAEHLFLKSWFVGQEKYDGIRAVIQIDTAEMGGSVRVYTRVTSKKSGLPGDKTFHLPHLTKRMSELFPAGTAIDGEIIVPRRLGNSHSTKVTQITGSKPERAVEWQEQNWKAEFAAFDMLCYEGVDLTEADLNDRLYALNLVLPKKPTDDDYIFFAPVYVGEGAKRAALKRIWASGGEGLILKDLHSPYNPKRDDSWVKVKAVRTFDVVVMGFEDAKETSTKKSGEESDTKYKGMVGAVVFGQYVPNNEINIETHPGLFSTIAVSDTLQRFGTVSGFDDDLRAAMTEQPEAYIGKVMTITAQERLESGSFRHPRFSHFRDDKNARDCVYDPNEA